MGRQAPWPLWLGGVIVVALASVTSSYAPSDGQAGTLSVGMVAALCVLLLSLVLVSPWQSFALHVLSVDALHSMSPAAFERYVAELFLQAGYQVEHVGASGDGGVDVRVWRDGRYGVVQCKRYDTGRAIGPATIRELVGARTHEQAGVAWIATTGRVTAGARQLAAEEQIGVLDAASLVEWAANLHPGQRAATSRIRR